MDSRRQNVRRQPAYPKRRRRRARRRSPIVWVLAIAALLIAVGCLNLVSVLGVGTARFYSGISVFGVELAGYTYSEGQTLMEQMLEQWRSRTFTFTYLESSWQLKASDISADLDLNQQLAQAWNLGHTGSVFARRNQILALRQNPVYLTSEPTYDEAALDAFIENIRQQIDVEPVDAEVVLTAEKPVLNTRSSVGYQLDVDAFKQQVIDLLVNGNDGDVTALPVETLQPAVDSSTASGGLELVVEWSTDTSASSSKRLHNVELALSKFNGMAVYPGQQISFNEVVGKRTVENGFNEAPEYNGTTVQTGVGGGVCQASSTLYGALLKLGFQIDERDHHYMTVGYTPASLDAAVSDSGKQDLVFTNNTDHVYYFYTSVDREKATVRVYGNQLEYRVELESEILEDNIASKRKKYEDDVEGLYVWYTDEEVLKSEGKKGRRSRAFRVYYDWDTGEEVRREELPTDYYYPQEDTYYRGVHERGSE
ncbi:MAG: VanW family protein [Clostridia bacterium]|nr:VanW family protein [Clostridia bacterium]